MIYRRLQARNPMMHSLGCPKQSMQLPQSTSHVPPCPSGWRFGEFEVQRVGLHYRVVHRCSDRVVRDTYTGRFWRWITAARIAQAMDLVQISLFALAVAAGNGATDFNRPDERIIQQNDDRARIAQMLGCSDDATTWPVFTIDRLIDLQRHHGESAMLEAAARLMRPPG